MYQHSGRILRHFNNYCLLVYDPADGSFCPKDSGKTKTFTVSPFPKVKGINSFIHNQTVLTHLWTHIMYMYPCTGPATVCPPPPLWYHTNYSEFLIHTTL